MATRPFEVVRLAYPAAPREAFRRWVLAYGVSRLSRSLTTDRRTVHTWTRLVNPVVPALATVRTIMALSTLEPHGRPLTYDDFFGPVAIASRTSHNYGRVRRTAVAPRTVLTRRAI